MLQTDHITQDVAENNRSKVKMSVMAGIDMSMVPEDYSFTLIY
jgi:beta-glucosidase